ncbi:MAG: hypothetical protein CL534_11345 [Ahrensia sp.]|nr:hypothetical protein [Ahrensia sp.]
MIFNQLVRVIAEATGNKPGRVKTFGRRLQEASEIPVGPNKWHAPEMAPSHASLILLALLSGETIHRAAIAAVDLAESVSSDGEIRLGAAISGLIGGVIRGDESIIDLANNSTVEIGDHGFATIRKRVGEQWNTPFRFMPAAGWTYDEAQMPGIVTTRTLPGAALIKIGEAMRNV